MKNFEWVNVTSLRAAFEALKAGGVVKAGGIDLLDRMKEGLDAPARVVNLRGIAELEGIREEPGGVSIGPLVTVAALAENATIKARLPALAQAAIHAATPNIRNVATVGGNLLQRPRCWYFRNATFRCLRKEGSTCFAQAGENQYHAIFENEHCAAVHASDLATSLVALRAQVDIASAAGTRRVDAGSMFVSPQEDITREHVLALGEILTRVFVPAPAAGVRSAYLKQKERESADWPIASVAAAVGVSGGSFSSVSVAFGAAAPIPWRAKVMEAELVGKRVGPEAITAAVRAELAKATPFERNRYKVAVFEAIARRAVLLAASP